MEQEATREIWPKKADPGVIAYNQEERFFSTNDNSGNGCLPGKDVEEARA